MKEYRVKVTLQYDIIRYVEAESEEDAQEKVEGFLLGDDSDETLIPENGVDIVNCIVTEHRD